MEANPWLAVTNGQTLRFFFEHLRDVSEPDDAPESEVLYNASVLAHFASTSTASLEFPGTPTALSAVFDLFVMDRSQQADPGIMEAAGSQCLLLTGFFGPQLATRYNVEWYASLGAGFYEEIAFRVVLFGLGLRLILGLIGNLPRAKRTLIALAWALVTACVFSGWHYVGDLGEAFELRSFVFRSVCGLAFTLIYTYRGFAPAVWTHTIYDAWILLF